MKIYFRDNDVSRSRKVIIAGVSLCCALLLILMQAGCANIAGEVRERNADVYQKKLMELTRQELPEDHGLSLDDCIRIALRNNLQGRTAEIRARVRKLERRIAFAHFLPTLQLKGDYTAWDHQPKIRVSEGVYHAMHDTQISTFAMEAQMPVFAPATWYLYAMHKRGEEIGGLLLEYTRQMITLQVTALYYQCLALQETEDALKSRVAAAEALQEQMNAYNHEGMVSEWQVKQVEALVLARRMALNHTGRSIRQAKADLLGAMGLSPLADIRLLAKTPLKAPDNSLGELVLQALLHNPQMHIADRAVEIQKDQARIAITNFLPRLVGFAGFTHTSDSFVFDPDYWMSGLAGVLTVFNGFANIHEYKAAREREREAMVQREEACLAVMLQVIKADLNCENAQEALALAEKSLTVAEGRLSEIEAQCQEGMVDASERLSAIAEFEAAATDVTNMRFQEQVCIATLWNVLGKNHEDNSADDNQPPVEKAPIARLTETNVQGEQAVPFVDGLAAHQGNADRAKEIRNGK
ncbi:MAG: TolC family protein [bacterium]